MSKERKWRIAIDLMGGEQSPQAIFEAVLQVQKEVNGCCTMIAIATENEIPSLKKQLLSFTADGELTPPMVEWQMASEVVEMEDAPLLAVRRKKHSSMALGIQLVKEKSVDALVSTGNTGALFASSVFHLPLLPTIERPALLVVMPTGKRGMAVLDVGANVNVSPKHLVDFARLGSLYQQAVHKMEAPKVALLNIGVEAGKGTANLKEAYALMQERFSESFLGNIEGREVFSGKVDVLVTDGFAGNIFLKTCEGVTAFLMDYVREKFAGQSSGLSPVLSHLNQQFNYSEHPGAFLAGIDGIVVKCHGNSNARALLNGIKGALRLAESDLIHKMKSHLV